MNHYLYILPRAFAVGILVSAPMGPIGMLIIQRTLSTGRRQAVLTGIGAGLSDLTYSLLTGFTLSFIIGFIHHNQFIIQMIGALVLAIFGIYLFRKQPMPPQHVPSVNQGKSFSYIGSGFLLTFSNSLIIFFIIGLFAKFKLILPDFKTPHFLFAFAIIFIATQFWWNLVTFLVDKLRRFVNTRTLKYINRGLALIILVMAMTDFGIAIQEKYFPDTVLEIEKEIYEEGIEDTLY